MTPNRHRRRAVLGIEELEPREAPSVSPWLNESFGQTPVGTLPANWSQWSSVGSPVFAVTANPSPSAPNDLAVTAPLSTLSARAWVGTVLWPDVDVSAAVRLDTLIPAQIYARGSNLNTATPTYYALSLTRGLQLQLVSVHNGVPVVLGQVQSASYVSGLWVRAKLSLSGSEVRASVYRPDTGQYLNSAGQWQTAATWALDVQDGSITGPGLVGLGRPASYAGTIAFDDFQVVLTGNVPPIPQHYSQIRIAELAYAGTPIGSAETQLLQNSVDLVVPAPAYLPTIDGAAPTTPQLLYTNYSSLYGDLLTDWLAYADAHGLSREEAFYHVTQATPFTGSSASSQPVNWFWEVYRDGPSWSDLTSQARGTLPGGVPFGPAGQSVYLAYPEEFREINLKLTSKAGAGWSGVLEYVTGVDAAGRPTTWAPLTTLTDTTAGLTTSGQITFDPPSDWKPASVNGSARLYYVRFRTITGGTAPVAATILGRDYVGANGTASGIIPAFDWSADTDHDGYLNNAEYARRRPGYNARFAYESRAFYGQYGQMRFATNPSDAAFRAWAVNYAERYLNAYPLASGLFVDNSTGRLALNGASVQESTSTYTADYATLLRAVNQAIVPHWVLANTAGGGTTADAIVAAGVSYFEESALRPLAQNYTQFVDLANLVARRAALDTQPVYAVLDSLPAGGSATDPRTELATLAEYYLVADPKTTFLDFFGGSEPSSTWTQHWTPAAAYDIGAPLGKWSLFATGADPSNPALTYRVYQRAYTGALVLYKPLSYANQVTGTLTSASATTFALGASYRSLNADGTLGAPVTSVTLRNGEGAILIKS